MAFIYPYVIHLADTDAAGVIYFAQGLAICHEAYESYLASCAIALPHLVRSHGLALPIVHSEADFFQPLVWGDRVSVHLTATPPKTHSFELNYTITPEHRPDAIAITAQTRHVCINPQTRRKVSLPDELREVILQLC
ncbi:MAG: acyl-CoA thioesterase [Spirulinaceae cyanobacterium]